MTGSQDNKSRWWFMLPVLLGIGALVFMVKNKQPLSLVPELERSTPVEVYTVVKHPLAPEIVAYGRVRPKRAWQAVAEIEGRLIYKHPQLERGQFLKAGTVLARVDPLQYELQLAEAKADLESVMSELSSLDVERDNTRLSLNIERRQLKLFEDELARKKSLLGKKLIASSSFDQEQRNLLSQRQKVLDLENRLRVIPLEREVMEAKRKVQQAKLADAELELSKTVISLPFDARIIEVSAELDQVVSKQQSLVTAHGLKAMEVESQVSIHDMRELISIIPAETVIDLGNTSPRQLLPETEVLLNSGNSLIRWQGEVTRISGRVDQNTGTVGVIVEIQQDLTRLRPSQQGPLIDGMFVEVRSYGVKSSLLAIPNQALHDGQVYLVNDQQRLELRTVGTLFSSGGWTAIKSGLETGDRLVINDLIPVIEGILLAPTEVQLPSKTGVSGKSVVSDILVEPGQLEVADDHAASAGTVKADKALTGEKR
ncbi:efflux RND transporter periplasmic adaptor subunit [Motiliproteus sp. MSK22-1]|uniref:efflux RND transporter periplasmic adaptor subunit n=1 Tax=Motiliproteus sp. MSK22-1 TaxID=1897630 RepID=UPI0009776907|nr:hypothetical protein [Motiliproteus sp. MSK22-1]OMH28035.1 hypothetical protein BGP75_21945 [Motiliproteus sp. MSK22-1]